MNLSMKFMKIRLFIQEYTPVFISILITLLAIFKKINLEFTNATSSSSFILSGIILGLLITHKSIILTIDKEKNSIFKKIEENKVLKKRFYSYLNNTLFISIILITYNIICDFNKIVYNSYIIIFLISFLISKLIRFILIFNSIFEKNTEKTF